MEKQKITVRVDGKAYTLISADEPEHVRRVAALVDRRIRELEAVTNMPSQQTCVLTCLNLADELMSAQNENLLLKRRLAACEQAEGGNA